MLCGVCKAAMPGPSKSKRGGRPRKYCHPTTGRGCAELARLMGKVEALAVSIREASGPGRPEDSDGYIPQSKVRVRQRLGGKIARLGYDLRYCD